MNKSSKEIAIEGFLVSLSVIIGVIEHQFSLVGIQIIQGLYVIPILFVQDMFGLKSGFWCLFSSSLIRTFFFSCAGVLGFLARMSVFFYMLLRKQRTSNLYKLCLFDLVGILLAIFVKIPCAYAFWKQVCSFNELEMIEGIIKIIIPTNLLRLVIVVVLSRVIKFDELKKNIV